MSVVVKFIPFVVFISMVQLMLTIGMDALLSLGIVIVANAVGMALVVLASGLFVTLVGKCSPVPFLKKALAFAPVPFSLNSSNACIPMTLKLCSEKLGVDSRLAMFSIPVGLQFNMNGSSFYTAMIAVLMARTLSVELNLNALVTLTVSTFLVSVTMAGCPGSAIIGLSTVFEAVGIPTAAVTLFLPVDSPVGMFRTVGNVTSDVASTMMLACSEKKADKEAYLAE